MQKKESVCVSRESNAGPIDGNDGFYLSQQSSKSACVMQALMLNFRTPGLAHALRSEECVKRDPVTHLLNDNILVGTCPYTDRLIC